MFVGKVSAQIFQKETCKVYGYGGTDDLSLSVAEIRGKYPKSGRARNREVDMTYFIIEGKGTFWLEDEVFEIGKEDFVLIEKGKWYRCEGDLKVVMASSPAWSPDQYEEKQDSS